MGETFDLMGYLIIVFLILVILVGLIKIFLMFPGLLDCSDDTDSERGDAGRERRVRVRVTE